MKILILGGTRFLGRHLAEAALNAGHEVTLFNRGMTDPALFPKVEHLRGNRDGDLTALEGRRWDVAVDTCGYVPRIVKASAEMLAGAVEHYTFISTISVYSDSSTTGQDESAPLGTMDDETSEDVSTHYGPLKVLCEQVAEAAMPGRVLLVRSGLIVGPHDPTDRFTYWPVRVQMGGEVLAPGSPDMRVQFIDVRDQVEWILRMAEARQTGVYNLTGPAQPLTMGHLLETCKAVIGSNAAFTWVEDDFLVENDVTPYTEMPLWIPASYNGLQAMNIQKAFDAGLTVRPLEQTIRDTIRWNGTRTGAERGLRGLKLRNGMMLDRESALLDKWKQHIPK